MAPNLPDFSECDFSEHSYVTTWNALALYRQSGLSHVVDMTNVLHGLQRDGGRITPDTNSE
jgi:hypothetical protein